MKHVTLGKLDRSIQTAITVKGEKAFYAFWLEANASSLSRRQLLKAMRDFMSPKRNHAARTEERRNIARWLYGSQALRLQTLGRGEKGRVAWVDESAALPDRKEAPAGQYRASGKSEAFSVFMARKLGIEVSP